MDGLQRQSYDEAATFTVLGHKGCYMKRCTLLVVIGLLLAGCSSVGLGLPRRDAAPPIPAYPNAQNVTKQPIVDTLETTTFDTTDSPDVVYTFYDKELPKQQRNGWQPFSKELRQYIAQGCPYSFFVTLAALPKGKGMTQVTVKTHRADWCY